MMGDEFATVTNGLAEDTKLTRQHNENDAILDTEKIKHTNSGEAITGRDGAAKQGRDDVVPSQPDPHNNERTHLSDNKQRHGDKAEDSQLLAENNRFQRTEKINAAPDDTHVKGSGMERTIKNGDASEGGDKHAEDRVTNEKHSNGITDKEVEMNKNNDGDGKYDNGVDGKGDEGTALSKEVKAPVAHTWKVPDGGWGWVVVVSALVISLIVDGLTYTFGIFLGDFERAFQEPKSKISLASSIQVGLYLFIGPVVSALTNRFGCRPVIIAGSFIASAAFIASSWSTDVTTLILTYGVIGGIGFGLMYLPAIVAVSIYFEERRAFATGIAVCGSGIGTFILAPLTDYLLYEYNWSWTLLILGALILNGVVFGGLVRPLELQKAVVDVSDDVEAEFSSKVFREQAKTPQGNSSSTKSQHQEEVPLLAIGDKPDNKAVVLPVKQEESKHVPFFSSTPNMVIHSTSPKVAFKDEDNKSTAESTVKRARSNTLDVPHFGRVKPSFTPNKPTANTQPIVRAHAPIGLAFISLSDADLNIIREDVHLPLSRRSIHLSGPLPFPEADRKISRDDQGLYVQSLKSLTSLSIKDGLEPKPSGIWSCLPVSARETLEQMLSLSILKDKRYWFVLMGNFFCMIGFYVPFVYVPDRAKQLGIEEDKAAFLLSIIGITNTIGRVMTGVVINFLNIDCLLVTTVALALAGIMTAMCPFCETYAALAGISAVFGVCVAAYISLCSVLLCELLGVENLTNAFGFVILFRGVACIMGPPIAGAIFDATGVYDPSFYIGGSMIVLGAVCHAMLLIPCCRRLTAPPAHRD